MAAFPEMTERLEHEGIYFKRFPINALSVEDYANFQGIRKAYYNRVLDRNPREVARFVGSTPMHSMVDLNTLVGYSRTKGQVYARQTGLFALDRNGRLRGAARYEDNVSSGMLRGYNPSRLKTLVGGAEIQAKLRIPLKPFAEKCHRVVEEIATDGTIDGFDELLVGMSMEEAYGLQPADSYPFEEETDFKRVLTNAGFVRDAGYESTSDISFHFGPDATAAQVEHWQAPSVSIVRERLFDIQGMHDGLLLAIDHIRSS